MKKQGGGILDLKSLHFFQLSLANLLSSPDACFRPSWALYCTKFRGLPGLRHGPAGRLRSPPTDPQICGAMPAAPQPTAASDSGDHKSPHSGGGPKSPPSLPPESAPECKDTRSCCIIKINKMKTLKSALCGELWGCFLKGAP